MRFWVHGCDQGSTGGRILPIWGVEKVRNPEARSRRLEQTAWLRRSLALGMIAKRRFDDHVTATVRRHDSGVARETGSG